MVDGFAIQSVQQDFAVGSQSLERIGGEEGTKGVRRVIKRRQGVAMVMEGIEDEAMDTREGEVPILLEVNGGDTEESPGFGRDEEE